MFAGTLRYKAGRMWPAGRMLPRPASYRTIDQNAANVWQSADKASLFMLNNLQGGNSQKFLRQIFKIFVT